MSDHERPGSVTKLPHLIILLIGIACITPAAPAVPDRPAPGGLATTQVVVIVPVKVEPFQKHQLEVVLYEYDPRVKGREVEIDKHVNKAFTHNRGTETAVTVTVGLNASVKHDMHYYTTVNVFTAGGRRTHVGEKDGKRGVVELLAAGKPNQVAMTVRPARVADIVMDIADEIKKGNDIKGQTIAKARAKDFDEVYEVMELYRKRNKGGLGWGSTPSAVALDGLEFKLLNISRGAPPAHFVQDVKNNEEAAYWIMALADLTAARDSDIRPQGQKSKVDWHRKAAALRGSGAELLKAIQAKNGPAMQQAAMAATNACNQCHVVYRD